MSELAIAGAGLGFLGVSLFLLCRAVLAESDLSSLCMSAIEAFDTAEIDVASIEQVFDLVAFGHVWAFSFMSLLVLLSVFLE